MLRVWRTAKCGNGELLYCELEDNRIVTIPKWMTNSARCNALSVGEPFVDISALLELRNFLDTHLAACRYGDFKNSELAREENGEEEIQMDDIPTTRAFDSKRAGDETAGVEQTRPDQCTCRVDHRTRQTHKRQGDGTR